MSNLKAPWYACRYHRQFRQTRGACPSSEVKLVSIFVLCHTQFTLNYRTQFTQLSSHPPSVRSVRAFLPLYGYWRAPPDSRGCTRLAPEASTEDLVAREGDGPEGVWEGEVVAEVVSLADVGVVVAEGTLSRTATACTR